MQDFTAVPVDSEPVSSEVRARRLTGEVRPAPAIAVVRPGLLDTRFVLAELSRLRTPPRPGTGQIAAGATGRRRA